MGAETNPWALYVYLPFSLAFMALGLVMLMAARSPVPVLPRRSLWLVAGFGFLHGGHEWLEMAEELERSSASSTHRALFALLDPLAIGLSFAFLMQGGIEGLIAYSKWPRWARVVPVALLLVWAAASLLFSPVPVWPQFAELAERSDALARLGFGLPAALVTAGLLRVGAASPRPVESGHIARYLRMASALLIAYGLVTGLLLPPGALVESWRDGADAFYARTHLPAEALRAVCALGFAGFLSEACVVQQAWMLVSLERQREEFVSVVAHDLRAPLTTISLAAQRLERLAPGQHETERERGMVSSIESSIKRLSRMIADLLDASRVEAKRLDLRKERVDLTALTRAVVERAAGMTAGHAVRVVAPEGLAAVQADAGRIEQVLDNLLSNAAKHSFPGAEVVVELKDEPGGVSVRVTNQGPGISAEEMPRLFSRFYRGKAAQEGVVEGLGLGLYITRGLVEAHGGSIGVESKPGESTTFRFTLPR